MAQSRIIRSLFLCCSQNEPFEQSGAKLIDSRRRPLYEDASGFIQQTQPFKQLTQVLFQIGLVSVSKNIYYIKIKIIKIKNYFLKNFQTVKKKLTENYVKNKILWTVQNFR